MNDATDCITFRANAVDKIVEITHHDNNDVLVFCAGQVRENVGKWFVKNDKVKDRTFTLNDIKEGSSYEFRVSAVNKAGQGPASAASASAKYGQLASCLIHSSLVVLHCCE